MAKLKDAKAKLSALKNNPDALKKAAKAAVSEQQKEFKRLGKDAYLKKVGGELKRAGKRIALEAAAAAAIHAARTAKNMTQTEAADASGMSRREWSRWETGATSPKKGTLTGVLALIASGPRGTKIKAREKKKTSEEVRARIKAGSRKARS